MSNKTAIRKVTLGEQHIRPGRTKHTLIDANGARPFPPFTSLVITRCLLPDDNGFYLEHLCADGLGTDTWHQTLEDALHQAEWEFGVHPTEWIEVNEPF